MNHHITARMLFVRQVMAPLAFLLLCSGAAAAELRLPGVLSSHMVLQRNRPVPIWGWADPGQAITVTFADQKRDVSADAAGYWRIELDPMPACADPRDLSIAVQGAGGGAPATILTDVLVGDVWLCAGQSNMQWHLAMSAGAKEEIPRCANAQIRLLIVGRKIALEPIPGPVANPPGWLQCSPGAFQDKFSAVAYYFGKELQREVGIPIGLIQSAIGGTKVQSWTSLRGLEQDPTNSDLQELAGIARRLPTDLPQAQAKYREQVLPKYEAQLAKWRQEVEEPFLRQVEDWKIAQAKAKKEGGVIPAAPKTPAKPQAPFAPDDDQNQPTVLYNGMIAPLIPFAITGTIWYQGETYSGAPELYRTRLPSLIRDWRRQWGQGDFPFLYVQLPNFTPRTTNPVEDKHPWPVLREAQLQTLALPNTGMAVAIDLGEADNIHPSDKMNVGKRLALVARKVVYGHQVVHSGPIFRSMEVADGRATIHFDHIGSGLVIGSAPAAIPGGTPAQPLGELRGFAIAGPDGKFVRAHAKIQGDSIQVWDGQVATPVAVRYAWSNNPEANLYNREGLPASPFRTDMPK